MKKSAVIFCILLIGALFIVSCNNSSEVKHKEVKLSIGNSGKVVNAEVVDTYADRMNGLMFREELGEFDGMFFIFEDEVTRSFWMKNTLIPLDIIFLDSDMTVVKIQHAQPCEADPCPTFSSESPSKYVLEVNLGFSEKYDLNVGNRISYFS